MNKHVPELPQQHTVLRKNYFLHAIEGGLFIGGMSFVAANTILPRLVELLHGPTWVIGITPILMPIGFALPGLLTAHWIETLPRVKPILLLSGIAQRVPYLIAALFLWYPSDRFNALSLYVVILAPLVSGLCGGITVTAWQDLVAKTLPPERRASVFATRNIISGLLGLVAGGVAAATLDKMPGLQGYALLHFICFAVLSASYVFFAMIQETHQQDRDPGQFQSLSGNLREMWRILKVDHNLRHYLVANVAASGIFIAMPFMAIHSLRTTGRPDSFLGFLMTALMAGGILGNASAGYVGDKMGMKPVLLAGGLVTAFACVSAMLANSAPTFAFAFFIMGGGMFALRVGHMAFIMEISPLDKRPTYLAIIAAVKVPGLLAASVLSTCLWKLTGSFSVLAAVAACCLLFASAQMCRVTDPRKG